ncbi:MAG: endonuclease NucS [Methylocystis sp.]
MFDRAEWLKVDLERLNANRRPTMHSRPVEPVQLCEIVFTIRRLVGWMGVTGCGTAAGMTMSERSSMARKITEADIRDHLAAHLDLIEPGLTLVDIEFHLPNRDGASGFLDIFARDALGRLVIIEIKRTDAAAREAIQELYKYVPLLRERFFVKDVDIRLILLSVAWHELATPYAEFAASAPYGGDRRRDHP